MINRKYEIEYQNHINMYGLYSPIQRKDRHLNWVKNNPFWDFPGGALVKNPPASAGDTGSIPGPGRSHMPWSN